MNRTKKRILVVLNSQRLLVWRQISILREYKTARYQKKIIDPDVLTRINKAYMLYIRALICKNEFGHIEKLHKEITGYPKIQD